MEQNISPQMLSNFIGQSQKKCMHASNIYIKDRKHTALQLALDYRPHKTLHIRGYGCNAYSN